jgi:hypothetical protein
MGARSTGVKKGVSAVDKVVRVSCEGAALLSLDRVLPFQGTLKELSKEDYAKLRRGLEKYGICSPLVIWRNKGKHFILDGHQRVLVLKKMRDEGWRVPMIPVSWIEAKDEREAKRKLLLMIGQYGRATKESLYEYINENGIDFGDIKDTLDVPDLNLGFFIQTFYSDTLANSGEGPGGGLVDVCPKCGQKINEK